MSMNKRFDIARKIKAMKVGDQFTVNTQNDRQQVMNISNALRGAGAIEFQIITRRNGKAWKVVAI